MYMGSYQKQHVLVLVLILGLSLSLRLWLGLWFCQHERNGHLIRTLHLPIAGDGLDQHVVAHESEDGNDGLVDQREVGQLWKVAFHDKLVAFEDKC